MKDDKRWTLGPAKNPSCHSNHLAFTHVTRIFVTHISTLAPEKGAEKPKTSGKSHASLCLRRCLPAALLGLGGSGRAFEACEKDFRAVAGSPRVEVTHGQLLGSSWSQLVPR